MAKYTPHAQTEIKEVLKQLGYKTIADMYQSVSDKVLYPEMQMPNGVSEIVCDRKLYNLANKNRTFDAIYMGAGVYNHYLPQAVSEFSCNAEIANLTFCDLEKSQSLMQAVCDVQTTLAGLMKMPESKISYADKNLALISVCLSLFSEYKNKLLVSSLIKPQTKSVIDAILPLYGIEIEYIDSLGLANSNVDFIEKSLSEQVFAVYVEQPNFLGTIEDLESIANTVHLASAKFIVGAYPTAFGLLKAPGDCGADVVVGDIQPLGLNLSFGGDNAGFICSNAQILSATIGERVVKNQNSQEFTVEKCKSDLLTSKIPLKALLTCGAYLHYLGKEGLKQVALQSATNAHYLSFALAKAGVGVKYKNEFFNEFVTLSKCTAENMLNALAQQGILGGYKVGTHEILWCATELCAREQMDKCAVICGEVNR